MSNHQLSQSETRHPTLKQSFNAFFAGKYLFDELINLNAERESRAFTIKKKEAYKANQKLADTHNFLRLAVLSNLKFNTEIVFSYRKNKNSKNAVEPHVKNQFYYITDFQNFFASLTQADIKKVIQHNLDIIPISDCDKYLEQIISLTTIQEKLPIGFSTSPILSNCILFDFDNLLQQSCSQLYVTYTRYADDLIFSSNQQESLLTIPQIIDNLLETEFNNRLRINKNKSKMLNKQSDKIKILGNVILQNGLITVDRSTKNDIESALYIYLNKPDLWPTFLQEKFPNGISHISGVLAHINAIDPAYIRKLKGKYGILAVDLFLKKILETENAEN